VVPRDPREANLRSLRRDPREAVRIATKFAKATAAPVRRYVKRVCMSRYHFLFINSHSVVFFVFRALHPVRLAQSVSPHTLTPITETANVTATVA